MDELNEMAEGSTYQDWDGGGGYDGHGHVGIITIFKLIMLWL